MNRRLLIASAAFALFAANAPEAHEYTLGTLQIDHPWARPSPPGAQAGAAYMVIRNTGAEPDRLVGAVFGGSERTEIHEMVMQDGVMKMGELAGGLEIPAGGEVALEPGGYHVMLIGLKAPLEEGQTVPLTVTFANAGSIEVELSVEKPAADGGHGHGHGHGSGG